MRPATGLSIGDIDHDGLNDIALDGTMTGAIPVYVQSGVDHSFARTDVTLPVEIAGVTGVALTDVDSDTNDDLLVITDADALSWALADGTGGFGAFSAAMAAAPVSAKEVGDLNDDGLADLATFGTDGSVQIYLQQTGGGLGAACSFPSETTPGGDAATAIGELTGDGATDLVDADVAGTSGGAWLYRQLTGTELLSTSIDAVASKSTMRVGKSVAISGTFHDPDGGCLRNGSVTLTRTGPGPTVLDDVAIGAERLVRVPRRPVGLGHVRLRRVVQRRRNARGVGELDDVGQGHEDPDEPDPEGVAPHDHVRRDDHASGDAHRWGPKLAGGVRAAFGRLVEPDRHTPGRGGRGRDAHGPARRQDAVPGRIPRHAGESRQRRAPPSGCRCTR